MVDKLDFPMKAFARDAPRAVSEMAAEARRVVVQRDMAGQVTLSSKVSQAASLEAVVVQESDASIRQDDGAFFRANRQLR